MSNLPNTTQTPNLLFNGEMAKMKDTELRVVLIVTRKTLGWIADPETGMRKEEDWISRSQLMKLTHRGHNAVSKAIRKCIEKEWIEARNKKGELLNTPEKRKRIGQGGKVFYRLGRVFLSRTKAVPKEDTKEGMLSSKRTAKRGQQKEDTTKGNPITKQTDLQNMSDKPTNWNLEEEIEKCLKDPKRHIQIIGVWIKEKELRPENAEQMQSIIKRNCKPARLLNGYSNEDIHETVEAIKRTDYLKKWTLETVAKFIDEVVAQKKKKGRKIIRWEEVTRPDGNKVMRAIYEEK